MKQLEPLVGEWEIEARLPGVEARGRLVSEWALGGRYLMLSSATPDPVPDSLSLIAPEGDDYVQHYYDTRGVTRLYRMTFDGRTWTLARAEADFSPLPFKQRYSGTLSGDGRAIDGAWERAGDDGAWMLDFELRYTRMD